MSGGAGAMMAAIQSLKNNKALRSNILPKKSALGSGVYWKKSKPLKYHQISDEEFQVFRQRVKRKHRNEVIFQITSGIVLSGLMVWGLAYLLL